MPKVEQIDRDEKHEEGVVSLYKFDTEQDRQRAKECLAVSRYRDRLAERERLATVTPEMLEAGIAVLWDVSAKWKRDGVKAVYLAMLKGGSTDVE